MVAGMTGEAERLASVAITIVEGHDDGTRRRQRFGSCPGKIPQGDEAVARSRSHAICR